MESVNLNKAGTFLGSISTRRRYKGVVSTPNFLLSLIPTRDWNRCILSRHTVSGAYFTLETHFALTGKCVMRGVWTG